MFDKQHELDCYYWCVICDSCIEGEEEILMRCTAPDGLNDCHERCCPECQKDFGTRFVLRD